MKLKWDRWLYGLWSAVIGGGSGAVVSGFTNAVIAPDTFNLTTTAGAWKLIAGMAVNFGVVAFFSMFFYLKQSPLPPEASGNTEFLTKPNEETKP